ncbi:Arylsulfatase [Roseimaritima multifibrata]|uniref:Arylsulfatase n=1 Tax=Roseimaritima multifibrata TaxID=1930274 RepID=A0A517MGK8_9BACT|nr:sulfatase-like hydrolase/transferase [Roseimaritima multifibrata]QDS93996.1 Arylsulfatase [Roseimaritima multifibrata]
MQNTYRILLIAILVACTTQTASSAENEASKPNIIILFADDWGYGDLGKHGTLSDVKTPHLDALADEGVLFTDAYITAPQCSPSRAGLITGRYQQRFGFDTIPDCPLPLSETTIADRLQAAGYVTGMVGKWHLEPNALSLRWAKQHQPNGIKNNRVQVRRELAMPYYPQGRGFEEFFKGERSPYWANYSIDGKSLAKNGQVVQDPRFRVDVQTDAALGFIQRHADEPFFLYVAHYAPHVPLEASEKYLSRFPGKMPERRRTGLAMINAVDEGIGQIKARLKDLGIAENTLIMFTSDNGAPLGAQTGQPMLDVLPVNKPGPAWDGSRNDPLRGEKGMLAEGGIRVPMIWSWPARLPKGIVVDSPVISLDMTATAISAAGIKDASELDGISLTRWLTGNAKPPERALYWRFWNQAAMRRGNWKYLFTSDGNEWLYDLAKDPEEQQDVLTANTEIAKSMRSELDAWTNELKPAGMPAKPLNRQEINWYKYYFNAAKAK